jgi:hypothetical protein
MKLSIMPNGCKTGCISKPSVIQEVAMDATDRHTSDPQSAGDVALQDSLWPLYLCKVRPVNLKTERGSRGIVLLFL